MDPGARKLSRLSPPLKHVQLSPPKSQFFPPFHCRSPSLPLSSSFFKSSPENILTDLRERGRERKRQTDRHQSIGSQRCPTGGLHSQLLVDETSLQPTEQPGRASSPSFWVSSYDVGRCAWSWLPRCRLSPCPSLPLSLQSRTNPFTARVHP